MRINLTILYEKLLNWNPFLVEHLGNDDMCYLGAQLLDDDVSPIENHVLVLKADCNNNCLREGGQALLIIGFPDKEIMQKNKCIIFPETTSLTKLFTDIQKIYMKYNHWEEELLKAVNNKADIQQLCDISEDIFENPILVFDNSLILLGITREMEGIPVWDYDEIRGIKAFPMNTLNDFKLDPEWQKTMTTSGPQMCPEQVIGYKVLYHNFWIDDYYVGRICINELIRKITKGDYALLEYFVNVLIMVFQKTAFHQSDKNKAFEQSLKDMLDGVSVNELLFTQRIEDIGWKKNDSHICVQIFIEERDSKAVSSIYTCNSIENHFKHCFVFPYKDSILLTINLEKNEKNIQELLKELKIFLREGLFRAGISMVSHDFLRFREYFLQTSLAITVGEKIDPMYWYFHFDDYIIPAMFYELSHNMSVDMYCERGLFELIKYDEEHQSDLYMTLKLFLDYNMNIAHTANKLFIHRSTLMYRLDKIKTLINRDIKEPEERFRFMLSYRLLEYTS